MANQPKTPTRSKFVRCFNCDGYIEPKLLDEEHYNNVCPLCQATGVLDG